MNLLWGNLEELFKKYQVYNVPTMGMDDFMVVSGMPQTVGKHYFRFTAFQIRYSGVVMCTDPSVKLYNPTRAFSWLKAATTAFTFKTLC